MGNQNWFQKNYLYREKDRLKLKFYLHKKFLFRSMRD